MYLLFHRRLLYNLHVHFVNNGSLDYIDCKTHELDTPMNHVNRRVGLQTLPVRTSNVVSLLETDAMTPYLSHTVSGASYESDVSRESAKQGPR